MATSINEGAPVKARQVGFINAPANRVWDVLSNLQQWPEWNADVSAMRMEGQPAFSDCMDRACDRALGDPCLATGSLGG
jgi:hypothetical protein